MIPVQSGQYHLEYSFSSGTGKFKLIKQYLCPPKSLPFAVTFIFPDLGYKVNQINGILLVHYQPGTEEATEATLLMTDDDESNAQERELQDI